METDKSSHPIGNTLRLILLFLVFLYLFLLSIQLMGASFKLFGKGLAEYLLRTTSDPLTGLFIGLLATSLTQSSSTTTSMVVGLVAGNALNMHNAIPIIMGANIGTTVTNTLVSLGHISRREEFQRAFSASVVHDVFNLMSVAIIFPLQYYTNYLEKISVFLEKILIGTEGMSFASPLKLITTPVAKAISDLAALLIPAEWIAPVTLILAFILLFASLRYMVRYMKALIMERAEVVFEQTIFRTPKHGLIFGMLLTALVQSSSVTTSLIVPLAGVGMIGLERVFPYTLGANIGTTVTAIMAALATGNPSALGVALSHLMFNVSGIALFWWIQSVPIGIARRIARLTVKNRSYAFVYIILIFFVIPIIFIYLFFFS